MNFFKKLSIFSLATILLSGCIFYPKTRHRQEDVACNLSTKSMYLSSNDDLLEAVPTNCSGDQCELILGTVAAISLGSAVISGSIVVIGNAIYWIEKQGKCDDSLFKVAMGKLTD